MLPDICCMLARAVCELPPTKELVVRRLFMNDEPPNERLPAESVPDPKLRLPNMPLEEPDEPIEPMEPIPPPMEPMPDEPMPIEEPIDDMPLDMPEEPIELPPLRD